LFSFFVPVARDAGILLADLQLRLKYRKSRVTSFAAGFEYLGALFQGALVIPPHARSDPKDRPTDTKNLPSEDVALSDDFMPVRPVRHRLDMPDVSPVTTKTTNSHQPDGYQPDRHQPDGHLLPWQPDTTDGELTHDAAYDPADPVYGEADISDSYHPFMRTLYVQQQGSLVTKDGSRFVVTYRSEPIASIPVVKVAQIMVFGNAHLTTPVLKHCLLTGTPVTFLSRRGNYYGRLDNPLLISPSLQGAQFATYHDKRRRLMLAKTLLRAKISNSRALLMRQRRSKRLKMPLLYDTIDALQDYHNKLQDAKTIEQAFGYEGSAAKAYFRVLGDIIDPAFAFTGRHKRPPTDPVNSLLSFGYSLLYYNMLALVHACGLHPYVGSLHALNDQHASLVSDLIEPFRAPIIDGLVLYLINKRILKPKDFYYPEDAEGACLLTNSARKTFIQYFEARLARKTTHPPTGYHIDWRRNMHYYAESYAQYLQGKRDFYEAFYHHQ
jgi:CRISPR-associated protein Cas1